MDVILVIIVIVALLAIALGIKIADWIHDGKTN